MRSGLSYDRPFFIQLMNWKGWDVPDIVMDAQKIEIP